MTTASHGFYIPYGTLPPDALSYVVRKADEELFAGLLQGEFCYVLNSRQMGKSSLMARTAASLKAEGIAVAILDLTALGSNLTPEQWYSGLLEQLGRRLGLQDEMDDFLREHEDLSPLQCWQTALSEVVLTRIRGQVVIFVDEIDNVRSLPFSTDEFFAAIRFCYNARAVDPEWNRLTFCLLGVATPSDLIQDVRLTPFNIGRPIPLTDFTEREAGLLQHGLGRDPQTNRRLMRRILHWTGGHPCLTQRLCQAVSEDTRVNTAAGVDRCSARLYFPSGSQSKEDNLEFVRQRLLAGRSDPAALLTLYRQVLDGKPVADDETVALIGALQLSGIVRAVQGRLHVRNRIYARVFDRTWIAEHMPDAELRRQRTAYRRGVMRTTSVATIILAAVVSLGGFAVTQARRAAATDAAWTRKARDVAAQTRRHNYVYAVDRAQRYLQDGHTEMAVKLLDAQRPTSDQEDLRGFEWRHLWQLCHDDLFTFRGHKGVIFAIAFSPDGRLLATASEDKTVRLWDVVARREVGSLPHTGEVRTLAFSPDGETLAAGSGTPYNLHVPGEVRLWDVRTRRLLYSFEDRSGEITAVTFSPKSRMLATGTATGTVKLWSVRTRQKIAPLARKGPASIYCVAFSPDGETLAVGSGNGRAELWNVSTRMLVRTLSVDSGGVLPLAFSPDGSTLATGGDKAARLWDAHTGRLTAKLLHPRDVWSMAFSRDGRTLATGCRDDAARLWDVATRRETRKFIGHLFLVTSVAFSPNGKMLASGSSDKTAKLWAVEPKRTVYPLEGYRRPVDHFALSPDGGTLASAGEDRTIRLWDTATGRSKGVLRGHTAAVFDEMVFSPNGKLLASTSADHTGRLWDLGAEQEIARERFMGPVEGLTFFSADGKVVALGRANDATLDLWNTAPRRKIADRKMYILVVCLTAFSPDGDTVAFSGKDEQRAYGDGTVEIWSMRARRRLAVIRGAHGNDITSLAFSPDGKILATGSWDRSIKLWDIAKLRDIIKGEGQERAKLFDDAGQVNSLAFSPDGKTLAAANEDHTIKLWSLATGEEVAVLSGHSDQVRAVTFSPDGNTLISVGDDGTLRLWQATPSTQTDAPSTASVH